MSPCHFKVRCCLVLLSLLSFPSLWANPGSEDRLVEQELKLTSRYRQLKDPQSKARKISQPFFLSGWLHAAPKDGFYREANLSLDLTFFTENSDREEDEFDFHEAYLVVPKVISEDLEFEIGRQVLLDGISLGVFDGLKANYQLAPHHRVKVFAGYNRYDEESVLGYSGKEQLSGARYDHGLPYIYDTDVSLQRREFVQGPTQNYLGHHFNYYWSTFWESTLQSYYRVFFNLNDQEDVQQNYGLLFSREQLTVGAEYSSAKDAITSLDRRRNLHEIFANDRQISQVKKSISYSVSASLDLAYEHIDFYLPAGAHGRQQEASVTSQWHGYTVDCLGGQIVAKQDDTHYLEIGLLSPRFDHFFYRYLAAVERYAKANGIHGEATYHEVRLGHDPTSQVTAEVGLALETTILKEYSAQGTLYLTYWN